MFRQFARVDWLAAWIVWSAWCSLSGWILSAFGHLDRAGYTCSLLVLAVFFALARRAVLVEAARPVFLLRLSTYRSWLPKFWLVLTVLALVGGLLYHPDNYDYLSYRFPRVLTWLSERRWFWIETLHDRQNYSAVGMEWLMAPLFAWFQTDRLFFLINFISFLFLPGLIFAVFCRLGISRHVAWAWMWVLPAGSCFILQAASMGNDGFSAVYLLAALYYAYETRAEEPRALVLSIVAMALLTGAKASNLPFILPWGVTLWQRRSAILGAIRPILLAAAAIVAAMVSFLPIALANIHYTGSYTGDPTNAYQLSAPPMPTLIGNVLELAAGNAVPPVWPFAVHWPEQERITAALHPAFPRFSIATVPLALEENAGLGLGVTLFACATLVYGLRERPRRPDRRVDRAPYLFAAASVVAALVYLAKLAGEATPRLFALYYIALIAAAMMVLRPEGRILRHRGWSFFACLPFLFTLPALILNPARPLLPENWIVESLRALPIPAASVDRLQTNYRVRGSRRDVVAQLRKEIPAGEKVIGYMSGLDDPEVSPWLPFGSRAVIEVRPTTDLAARQVHYVILNGRVLQDDYHMTLPELLARWSMKVEDQEIVRFKTERAADPYYLLAPRSAAAN